MGWLRRLVHRWVGRDRYHDQANEVTVRTLRAEYLSKQLEVVRRAHQ